MEKKLDLRVEKTYRLLHMAFSQLLEEKNFDEITVNELCDKAMIRRTTFYKHFADKYQYYAFFIKELNDDITSVESPDKKITDPNSYITTISRSLLSFISSHKNLVDHIVASNMDPLLFRVLQEEFEEQISLFFHAVKKSTSSAPDKLIVSFCAGGLMNIVMWWISHPESVTEEELFKSMTGLMEQLLLI